jgi:hypothetical protein
MCSLTYDVFVASWVTTLRRFGTTCIYVSSLGALHIIMMLMWHVNDVVSDECVDNANYDT